MRDTTEGMGKLAVGVALLLATVSGCGDDTSTDREDPPLPATAGAGSGAADDAEPARELDIEVHVSGSDEPIAGRVSERGGPIQISSYPNELALPISYGALPLTFEGAFSDEFCQSVADLLDLETPDAVELVRHRGAVSSRIPISSLVGPGTTALAQSSARELGISSGVFFDNPLMIEHVEISLELEEGALSDALGIEDLTVELRDALSLQSPLALQTGVIPLALGAKDLWCDLAHGGATIRIELSGSFGEESYSGETLVRGVAEL